MLCGESFIFSSHVIMYRYTMVSQSIAGHPADTPTDNLESPSLQFWQTTGMCLGGGRRPKNLEATHTDMEIMLTVTRAYKQMRDTKALQLGWLI